MLEIKFHSPEYYPHCGFTYVVIGARYRGRWVFIRHRHRRSYEIPAGHINEHEDPDIAAGRELEEETGAKKYTIECISTYTIMEDEKLRAGRLYYADIEILGEKTDDSEIERVVFSDQLPEIKSFTYVQTVLFRFLEDYTVNKSGQA
ncbi:MAG: NUDIX domain-containing protein [Bacteroidales bacterium]|jgi:8-oxo-dGTP diphosphatase|nr:NUDIX domain-containing protein [Bacteroidales bacterium]